MDVPHRQLAAQAYNDTWALLERDRSPEQDRDLLGLALTSRHHWQQVGGPQELAVADWMVSRCFAAVGSGDLALSFAQAALQRSIPAAPAWLRASLLEGMARALQAAGDESGCAEHVALCSAELAKEPDEDDRRLIESQLDDLR